MSKVIMQTELNVSPDDLWNLIGGFNALPEWHPAVQSSDLEQGGKVRRLHLVGGGEIVERLEQLDDNERIYTYSIINSPLPVANYTATIRVLDQRDGTCIVEWTSDFEANGASEPDAIRVVQSIYQAGFDNLRRIFAG